MLNLSSVCTIKHKIYQEFVLSQALNSCFYLWKILWDIWLFKSKI